MARPAESLWQRAIFFFVSIGTFVAYYLIYGAYFPNEKGGLGQDYLQQIPNLLTGYFWYQNNGLFSVPWFNPAQCGGVPFYADPGHGLYSLPQLLVLFFNPTYAIKITFVVFALAGYLGFYLLLKRIFRINKNFALAGATLFLFNGFYAYRMIAGHPFHSFMLVPWLAMLVLAGPNQQAASFRSEVWRGALAGVVIAYMFQSAMMHIIPPVILAIVVIILIYSFLHGYRRSQWLRLGIGIVFAIGLCASKLVASLSFLKQFPRDAYSLPGFSSPFAAFSVLMQSLFTRPPVAMISKVVVNAQWAIGQHELEFGVTPIPLAVILIALILHLIRFSKDPKALISSYRTLASVGGIAVLLLIPLAINVYSPPLNAFLKSIPIIKSSSLLIRWFAMYIPIVILISTLLVDSFTKAKPQAIWIAMAIIILAITYQATENRAYYDSVAYKADPIERAYEQSKASGTVIPIRGVAVKSDTASDRLLQQNNLMAVGLSQLNCYDAVFGYHLEWLPVGELHPGPALEVSDDHLNFKNPACYVFPEENNCRPGDPFKVDQRAEAERFLDYRPFVFRKSMLQRIADVANLGFLVLLTVVLVFPLAMAVIERGSSSGGKPIRKTNRKKN